MTEEYDEIQKAQEEADLTRLALIYNESQACIESMKILIGEYTERKRMWQDIGDRCREALREAMNATGVTTAKLPAATISLKATPPNVQVIDESLLPDDCVKVERKPIIAVIKEQMSQGRSVPGVILTNGGQTVQIRMK